MKTSGNDVDYTDTLHKQFGKPGYIIGMICFIINFSVPIILFAQLLSQDLYPVILFFIELAGGPEQKISHDIDFREFSYSYTCIIIFMIVFAMVAPRNTGIYNKINSFGVIFIMIIIVFTCGVGIYSLSNTSYTLDKDKYQEYIDDRTAGDDYSYVSLVKLFSKPYGPLMGILGGGYYFHNISLSVCRNSRNPENNVRDVFLGYLATFITYVLCGTMGYFGFTGSHFATKIFEEKDLEGSIAQNSLDMFDTTSILATIIRFCAFAQLLTVNALLISLERSQILLLATGTQDAGSTKKNLLMNFAILILPYILAIVYPNVADIAGIMGALASLLVVYLLPVFTYLKYKHTAIYNPELATMVQRATVSKITVSPTQSQSEMMSASMSDLSETKLKETSVMLSQLGDEEYVTQKDYGSLAKRKREFYIGLVCGITVCIYAVFVLSLQI